MADVFARKLRSETEEEGLDSLLSALRALHSYEYPAPLRIPSIDSLISSFLCPLATEPADPWASPTQIVRPAVATTKVGPPVIEIVGLHPCSGKTQLLYLSAARALLPLSCTFNDGATGGGSAVIWIDADGRLDILRLHVIMQSLLLQMPDPIDIAHSNFNIDETEEMPVPEGDSARNATEAATTALSHLHVFRPTTSASLLATIRALPEMMLGPPGSVDLGHPSSGLPVSTLVLSSATTFLSAERLAASEDKGKGGTVGDRYAILVGALKEVQRTLDCVVLAGSRAFAGKGAETGLPQTWAQGVDVKVEVERDDNRKTRFEKGFSVEESLAMEDDAWKERVELFRGLVRRAGAGGQAQGDSKGDEDKRFTFIVGKKDVVFVEEREVVSVDAEVDSR